MIPQRYLALDAESIRLLMPVATPVFEATRLGEQYVMSCAASPTFSIIIDTKLVPTSPANTT